MANRTQELTVGTNRYTYCPINQVDGYQRVIGALEAVGDDHVAARLQR